LAEKEFRELGKKEQTDPGKKQKKQIRNLEGPQQLF